MKKKNILEFDMQEINWLDNDNSIFCLSFAQFAAESFSGCRIYKKKTWTNFFKFIFEAYVQIS